jgi:hypothetical protein
MISKNYPMAQVVGGPVEKTLFFQMDYMTKLSTQIHSYIPQYDVYKVLSKKMSGRCPLGVSKSTFLQFGTESELSSRIFDGFLSSKYSLLYFNDTLFTPY